MSKKHICVWSGKRGGFGAMLPTMEMIKGAEDMRLSVVVTDQHLYEKFGKTISEVQAGIGVDAAIDMGQTGDSNADRGEAVGVCLQKAVRVLEELDPDVLLVIGDRGEVFAACIAAHNLRIAVAHVQGGDISGSLDEPVRHAITKLAHIHFPSTAQSAARILKMGEEAWRVHTVGDTHIDQIFLKTQPPEAEIRERYNLPDGEPFLLVLQHSDSTVAGESRQQIEETLAAVTSFGLRTLLVYPCSDQGFEGIIEGLNSCRDVPGVTVHQNIPAGDFIGLQKLAGCFVGNSSAGLIEAPYFGLPTVNIGDRQIGRERCVNLQDVPYDREKIRAAIDRALNSPGFREACADIKAPFGDGTAYRQIVQALRDTPIDERLLNKRMSY